MAGSIYIVNGPNLNLLGTREPEIYGSQSLKDIEARCREVAAEHGMDVNFFQSNHEGAIIDCLQEAIQKAAGLIINAAAYTHTSIAIHDALKVFKGPKIELHISNPHSRESFRHVSFVSPAVDAVVAGLGVYGYELVTDLMSRRLARGGTGR